MIRTENIVGAAGLAALAAGPAFMLTILFASVIVTSGQSLGLEAGAIQVAVMVLLLSIPFGFLPGFFLCLFPGTALAWVGESSEWARSPLTWLGSAVVVAVIVLWIVDGLQMAGISVPFVAAAMICAGIMRSRVHWD